MSLIKRPRRLRGSPYIRKMVQETRLSPDQFIQPAFIVPGKGVRENIGSMPGVGRYSVDTIVEEAREIWEAGVGSMLLFGIPPVKDERALGAYAADGIVQQALKRIKDAIPDLFLVTDICLCEYMSHGHCGIVDNCGKVVNDPTLELLGLTAISHAAAGADMVAPSDMMDGRVAAIRNALDRDNYVDLPIMSYSAKYASCFYGPFRDAAESAPAFGDRKTYQMDPPNAREAMREIALDLEEGADIVMVKPATPYLDVIRMAHDRFDVPIAAYHVSGEYSMIKAAAANGWIDEKRAVMETMTAISRAGASIIITYFAKDISRML